MELASLSAFHFLRPWWLLLFIPIACAYIYRRSHRQQIFSWEKAIAKHLLPALTIKGGHNHWFNPPNMGWLLLLLSVMLMAGPSWQQQPSPFVEDQAVLVVAIDLSNTMNQSDVQPTRLERAKQKVEDLLQLRGNARTGLIAYSGSAHQVVPLSNDPDIIRQFLAAINTVMMPKAGKFPEMVLPLADQMLSGASAPGTLLLMADGIGPDSLAEFEDYFDKSPYQLLVMGVGLSEADERIDEGAQFGGVHLALQERALKSLAAASDGSYLSMSVDTSDVRRINRLIDSHLTRVRESGLPWFDAGYFLMYPITLLFLLWFRQGWTLNWCLAVFVLHSMSFPPPGYAQQRAGSVQPTFLQSLSDSFLGLWLTRDQQGQYHFEQGDYSRAAKRFEDPAWRGMAFYYSENFSAAAEMFTRVDSPAGRFNLANALAQGQHYVAAVSAYSAVLEEQPDHQAALINRDFVQQIVDDINRMSASQRTEPGERTRDLGNASQRGDGAEQQDISREEEQQLTAEALLADENIHEMWMRQVQADPARFLSAKFNLQYSREGRAEDD